VLLLPFPFLFPLLFPLPLRFIFKMISAATLSAKFCEREFLTTFTSPSLILTFTPSPSVSLSLSPTGIVDEASFLFLPPLSLESPLRFRSRGRSPVLMKSRFSSLFHRAKS